jgi:hydroxymethylpyrimidine pyrophosphatase-like HAD family hydrolase
MLGQTARYAASFVAGRAHDGAAVLTAPKQRGHLPLLRSTRTAGRPSDKDVTMTEAEPALVALDLDGTLLDPEGRVGERSRHAIGSLRAAGVAVVLASGRSPWGMREVCEELELDGPHITMQGGLIAAPRSGAIGRAWTLSEVDVRAHLAFAREIGIPPLVCYTDGTRAEQLPVPSGRVPWPLLAEAAHLHLVKDLDAWAGAGAIRTVLATPPGRHAQVRDLARRRFGSRYAPIWGDEHGVELLARGVGKGAALRALATSWGIGLERVAAIGDGPNDRTMLQVAGVSAAMGSAPPDVQAAASFVVPSNAEEGAYDALRRLFPSVLAGGEPAGRSPWPSPARRAGPVPSAG